MSHYYSSWEVTTVATTTQQSQVTKSLKEIEDELAYEMNNTFFQPFNLSKILELTPRESYEKKIAVFYYGFVDYDDSL